MGLIALGNCNLETAGKLGAALSGAHRADDPVVLDLDLVVAPEVVPGLRRMLRACLGAPCADVQLCVTELVGNVIRHVGEGTRVRVRASRNADRIRVEVSDPAPRARLLPRHATADDETGRGLALLDAMALRWGVDQGEASKSVWCEIAWDEPTQMM
ncbi:ATP-binding protein [Streptomyces tibetensis]|uniref:ATP-binding protein n=1 Tax=Streptomyces tibetensis TaxID=2382123 RepID=UPI0033E2766F